MKKYLNTILRLWKLLKLFHKHFYLQMVFIVSIQLVSILTVLSMSHILNNIVAKDFLFATYFTIVWFALNSTNSFISYYSDKNELKNLITEIQQHLQQFTFVKVFNLNAFQYLEDHSAIKMEVISRGELAVQDILKSLLLNVLPTTLQTVFSIIAIYLYSPIVALICLITFLIVFYWSNKFSIYHRPFIKENIRNWDDQKRITVEAFQHLSVIKTFGIEDNFIAKYIANRQKYSDFNVVVWLKSSLYQHKRRLFFNLSRILSMFSVIYQTYLGKMLIGDVYAVWTWLNDIFTNIRYLEMQIRNIPLRFVELEKYLEIIDKKPEFDENGKNESFVNGNIIFENVSFKYPKGENEVIENLNIEIPKGKKIAFVGFSGSGKSTIIKLLLRIYDWKDGDIKIGNVSLRDINAKVLRKNIGYVEQHVDLFDTSIKENILFGIDKDMFTEVEQKHRLDDIIKKSRIDQFFHRLGEKGLDTVIGERGVKLSGGERQRIGIARALIKNPEILIFDEATASLDNENEKYIQEAIDESSKGRTTIIIAHRLSTVQNADIIFVMDKGKIVASGTHEELKENNEEYQRLNKSML